MSSFSNQFAYVCHHKTSIKEKVKDYVIKFNTVQQDIESIIPETFELIEQLFHSLDAKKICARLIAKVNFIHFNSLTDEQSLRTYYFPSYKSEQIEDVEDFFVRHMTKIASRLDSFNQNGSNLVIENVECIFIQLTLTR